MKTKLFILSILTVTFLSCKKDESPLIAYSVVDGLDWVTQYAQGDCTYRFRTIAISTTGAVKHIMASSFDTQYGDKQVLDTIFQDPVKKVDMKWLYHTPIFETTTKVEFKITAYATDGETATSKVILAVKPVDQTLTAVDNISMYSDLSGKPSCFSIVSKSTFMKNDTLDVKSLYFYDVAPADSSDNLSLMWRSNDIYFARSENFNFAEATTKSVQSSYDACQRYRTIQNLKYDDVILFGTATSALGVLKINYIIDDAERLDDRYNFSLKLIPSSK